MVVERNESRTEMTSHMVNSSLLNLVQRLLIPAVKSLTLTIVDHDESESFGDALVVLVSSDFRMRIVSDRGQIFADFGAPTAPWTWWDSATIFERFDLSKKGGFRGRDVEEVLEGIATFVDLFGADLRDLFSDVRRDDTTRELSALRQSRTDAMFSDD